MRFYDFPYLSMPLLSRISPRRSYSSIYNVIMWENRRNRLSTNTHTVYTDQLGLLSYHDHMSQIPFLRPLRSWGYLLFFILLMLKIRMRRNILSISDQSVDNCKNPRAVYLCTQEMTGIPRSLHLWRKMR